MDVKELQDEIKNLLHTLGLTQRQAAEIIWIAQNDDVVDDEETKLTKFYESFKKALGRRTSSIPKLTEYRDILLRDPKARKLNLVSSSPIHIGDSSPLADRGFQLQMKKLSQDLDAMVLASIDAEIEDD